MKKMAISNIFILCSSLRAVLKSNKKDENKKKLFVSTLVIFKPISSSTVLAPRSQKESNVQMGKNEERERKKSLKQNEEEKNTYISKKE